MCDLFKKMKKTKQEEIIYSFALIIANVCESHFRKLKKGF